MLQILDTESSNTKEISEYIRMDDKKNMYYYLTSFHIRNFCGTQGFNQHH